MKPCHSHKPVGNITHDLLRTGTPWTPQGSPHRLLVCSPSDALALASVPENLCLRINWRDWGIGMRDLSTGRAAQLPQMLPGLETKHLTPSCHATPMPMQLPRRALVSVGPRGCTRIQMSKSKSVLWDLSCWIPHVRGPVSEIWRRLAADETGP